MEGLGPGSEAYTEQIPEHWKNSFLIYSRETILTWVWGSEHSLIISNTRHCHFLNDTRGQTSTPKHVHFAKSKKDGTVSSIALPRILCHHNNDSKDCRSPSILSATSIHMQRNPTKIEAGLPHIAPNASILAPRLLYKGIPDITWDQQTLTNTIRNPSRCFPRNCCGKVGCHITSNTMPVAQFLEEVGGLTNCFRFKQDHPEKARSSPTPSLRVMGLHQGNLGKLPVPLPHCSSKE